LIFLEPKALYRSIKGEVPAEPYSVPLSTLRQRARRAARDGVLLRRDGAAGGEGGRAGGGEGQSSANVADLRTLLPLDEEGVLEAAKATGRHRGGARSAALCGFGAEISAMIAENIIEYMEAARGGVTGFDTPFPNTLEHHYMPDDRRILDAIEHVYNF